MGNLKGYQKKYIKGLVHGAKPVVFVGQKGLSRAVLEAVEEQLDTHEAIKLKFVDFKEKEDKQLIAREIEKETGSELVEMIGHVAIFYRQQPDPGKRRIKLPEH